MKLCAVQLASLKGEVSANLQRHLACIEQAAALGAEPVVFPELSLTGYEPTVARQAAMPALLANCIGEGLIVDTRQANAIALPLDPV